MGVVLQIQKEELMICSKCGREYADDVKFCTNCGAELSASGKVADADEPEVIEVITSEAAGENEETAVVAVTVDKAVKEDDPEVVTGEVAVEKKHGRKKTAEKTEAEEKGFGKWKLCLALVAVLVLILISTVLTLRVEAYTKLADKSVLDIYEEDDRLFAYFADGEKLFLNDTEVDDAEYSMDKTVLCYRNENGDLSIIKDGAAIKTGIDDAKGVKVSATGDTLVYFSDCKNTTYYHSLFGYDAVTEVGTLHLYYIKKGKDITVAEDVLVSSAVLSPDGETVAYVADYEATDDFVGYYSVKGKKPVEVGKEKRVFAIADKGAYVYYTDDDRIYVQKKRKEAEKLASDLYSANVFMNADCTEMMFVYDGKTYVTVKGEEKKKVSGSKLDNILLNGDAAIGYESVRSDKGGILVTYTGAESLKENLYYCNIGDDIVYVTESFEAERLAADADEYAVADDGESLVYIDGTDIVKVNEFAQGGRKTDLCEDADARVMFADGDLKYVYYINREDELYCIKGKKAKKIADDVTSAAVSSDGTYCYYVVEHEKLCYSKKGGKGKELFFEEEAKIVCETDYGITVARVSMDKMIDVYRMDGKEYVLFLSYEADRFLDYFEDTYDLDEPYDFDDLFNSLFQ